MSIFTAMASIGHFIRSTLPKYTGAYASLTHKAGLRELTQFRQQRWQSSKSPGNGCDFDVVVVGAGIVGLATAREISLRYPLLRCAVLDKENIVAAHQSGNNSGVIHAGIYYAPGSLKATLCVEGLKLAYKYCDENGIKYSKCGKLIVAVTPEEVPRLDSLYERGLKNGVEDLKLLDAHEIKSIEPNCVGLKALHSPHTGIVDWGEVTRSFSKNFREAGGKLMLGFDVTEFKRSEQSSDYPVTIVSKDKSIRTRYVITCAGLQSDRLAAKSGALPHPKIIPFRGEYLKLKDSQRDLVRGNIYPVPDPRFPFLGVHFTPRINGDVWLGPNAVLAFKREGYKLMDVSMMDLVDSLSYRGLRKLILGNMTYALGELHRGINKNAQVRQLQKFVPKLRPSDVTRGSSGVRAQAVDLDGNLVDDFVFDSGSGPLAANTLHVRNAPSPAATSSLAIAKMVADKAENIFNLAALTKS